MFVARLWPPSAETGGFARKSIVFFAMQLAKVGLVATVVQRGRLLGARRDERVRRGERAVRAGEARRAGVSGDRRRIERDCPARRRGSPRTADRPSASSPASRISRHSGPKSGRKKMLRSAQAWSSIFSCAACTSCRCVTVVLGRADAHAARSGTARAQEEGGPPRHDSAPAAFYGGAPGTHRHPRARVQA